MRLKLNKQKGSKSSKKKKQKYGISPTSFFSSFPSFEVPLSVALTSYSVNNRRRTGFRGTVSAANPSCPDRPTLWPGAAIALSSLCGRFSLWLRRAGSAEQGWALRLGPLRVPIIFLLHLRWTWKNAMESKLQKARVCPLAPGLGSHYS